MDPDSFKLYAGRVLSRMRNLPIDAPDLYDFITPEETAEILRVTKQAVYDLRSKKLLPAIGVGGHGRKLHFHFASIEKVARCDLKMI